MSAVTSTGAAQKLPALAAPANAFVPPAALDLASDRDQLIQSLEACGWSHRRIGRIFGLASTTVDRILQRLITLPPAPAYIEPLTSAEIYFLSEEYATAPELSPAERAVALDWLDGQRQAEPPPL